MQEDGIMIAADFPTKELFCNQLYIDKTFEAIDYC